VFNFTEAGPIEALTESKSKLNISNEARSMAEQENSVLDDIHFG